MYYLVFNVVALIDQYGSQDEFWFLSLLASLNMIFYEYTFK